MKSHLHFLGEAGLAVLILLGVGWSLLLTMRTLPAHLDETSTPYPVPVTPTQIKRITPTDLPPDINATPLVMLILTPTPWPLTPKIPADTATVRPTMTRTPSLVLPHVTHTTVPDDSSPAATCTLSENTQSSQTPTTASAAQPTKAAWPTQPGFISEPTKPAQTQVPGPALSATPPQWLTPATPPWGYPAPSTWVPSETWPAYPVPPTATLGGYPVPQVRTPSPTPFSVIPTRRPTNTPFTISPTPIPTMPLGDTPYP